jgi:hypothetical protein
MLTTARTAIDSHAVGLARGVVVKESEGAHALAQALYLAQDSVTARALKCKRLCLHQLSLLKGIRLSLASTSVILEWAGRICQVAIFLDHRKKSDRSPREAPANHRSECTPPRRVKNAHS